MFREQQKKSQKYRNSPIAPNCCGERAVSCATPGIDPDASDNLSENAMIDPPGDTDRADVLDPANDIISAAQWDIWFKYSIKNENVIFVNRLPFGDRILFLVLLPPTLRVRRIGRIAFFRRKYLASTPNNATPAVTETTTTCK